MKGHLEPLGKNTWSIVLETGRDAEGIRRRRRHTFHGRKRDAEAEMNQLLHELETGHYLEPSRLLVREYLERWLQDYAKPNTAPRTYERYCEIVRKHLIPALGNLQMTKLRPMHIQKYYAAATRKGRLDGKGGLSARTVLHHHRILHEALKHAVRWQVIQSNPSDAVQPPRALRPEVCVLPQEDISSLLRASRGTELFAPVLLGVTTGMRRGEVLGLKWQDVDFERATLTVRENLQQTQQGLIFCEPKTKKSRRNITLPPFVVRELKKHRAERIEALLAKGRSLADSDVVSARDNGEPWSPNAFSTAFRVFRKKHGLPDVTFHGLRHSHATQLLLAKTHPKIVSERLGHSTIGITLDTYTHVLPGMQDEAARQIDEAFRDAIEGKG